MGLTFPYSVYRKEVSRMGRYTGKKTGLTVTLLTLLLLPFSILFSLTKHYR